MAPGALPALPIMIQRLWASRLLRHRKAQLLLVNLLTFGLEVCLAAGITYVPPLLLEVGVEEKFMTMVLGESLHLPFFRFRCPGLGCRQHFSCPGNGSEGSIWRGGGKVERGITSSHLHPTALEDNPLYTRGKGCFGKARFFLLNPAAISADQ